jgi:ketosteroid isomerase-like protein
MRAVAVALMIIAAVDVHAQDRPPGDSSKIEQQLMQLEREWIKADFTHDAAWYGEHLADDFTSVDIRGRVGTKADELADAKARRPMREKHAIDDMKVRVYGNTAVVTGKVTTRQGPTKDRMDDYQLRFTDVFVYDNGRWRVVATQGTRIVANAP